MNGAIFQGGIFLGELGVKPVSGLVSGSSSAAAVNTNILQAALTRGGLVYIDRAGTYWINASLVPIANNMLVGVQGVIIKMANACNVPCVKNANRSSAVDTNIFIQGIKFVGNKANQTVAYSTVDMMYAAGFFAFNCEFDEGLRTGTFGVDQSSDGEGLVLRNTAKFTVMACKASNNDYDGFKTRFSTGTFTDCKAYENGRSGIQIAGTNGSEDTEYSSNVVVNGLYVYHSTGTPDAASPTTSGIYFHGAINCAANNITVYGTRQAVGFSGLSTDNVIHNVTANCRGVAGVGTIHFSSTGSPMFVNRNAVTGVTLRPISGASMEHITYSASSSYNRVQINYGSVGAASGTWTITNASGNTTNTLEGRLLGAVLTDSGTLFDCSNFSSGEGNMRAVYEIAAAGAAYTLTNSQAALNFGTTDPELTIPQPGRYLITARIRSKMVGATFAATKAMTMNIRRTNNTAANLSGGSTANDTGVVTTVTQTFVDSTWECVYITPRSDDVITVFGDIETVPSAGSLTINACKITAERLGEL